MTTELTCIHCRETRLVERIGLAIFCNVCGRTSPPNGIGPDAPLLGTSEPTTVHLTPTLTSQDAGRPMPDFTKETLS